MARKTVEDINKKYGISTPTKSQAAQSAIVSNGMPSVTNNSSVEKINEKYGVGATKKSNVSVSSDINPSIARLIGTESGQSIGSTDNGDVTKVFYPNRPKKVFTANEYTMPEATAYRKAVQEANAQRAIEQAKAEAEKSTIAGITRNVYGGMVGSFVAPVGTALNRIHGNPINTNASYYNLTKQADAAQQALQNKAANAIGAEEGTFKRTLSDLAVGSGLSVLQTAARLPLASVGKASNLGNTSTFVGKAIRSMTSPSLGSLQAGLSAGTSAMLDAKQRGGTDKQAVALGLLQGINEGLFESWSLGNLVEDKAAKNIGDVIKYSVAQMAAEGSEEAFTDIGNEIADRFVMAEKSSFNNTKKQYMDMGFDEKTAKKNAYTDLAKQVLASFVGGALAGAALGGAGSLIDTGVTAASALGSNPTTEFNNILTDTNVVLNNQNAQDAVNELRTARENIQNKDAQGQKVTFSDRYANEKATNAVRDAIDSGDITYNVEDFLRNAQTEQNEQQKEQALPLAKPGTDVQNVTQNNAQNTTQNVTNNTAQNTVQNNVQNVQNNVQNDKEARIQQIADYMLKGNEDAVENVNVSDFTDEDYEAINTLIGNNATEQNVEQNDSVKTNTREDIKEIQNRIIQETNPATDDIHSWVRSADDIGTFEEEIQDLATGNDFTQADAQKALETGNVTVYSSKPIENGVWVTPSRMEAQNYAGDGKVYSKTVNVSDVAWLKGSGANEGQLAVTNGVALSNNTKYDNVRPLQTAEQVAEKVKGDNNVRRNNLSDEGSERNVPQREIERSRRLQEESGRLQKHDRRAADEEFRDNQKVDRKRSEEVIPDAVPGQTVYTVKENTKAIKEARKLAEEKGVKNVVFFASDSDIKTVGGEKARAFYDSKTDTIGVRVNDSAETADRLIRHELAERAIARGEIDVNEVFSNIADSVDGKGINEILDIYFVGDASSMSPSELIKAYEAAKKEFVCDTLAGINQFKSLNKGKDLVGIMDKAISAIENYSSESRKINLNGKDGKVDLSNLQETIFEMPDAKIMHSVGLYNNKAPKETIKITSDGAVTTPAEEKSGREMLVEAIKKYGYKDGEKVLNTLDNLAKWMKENELEYKYIKLEDVNNAKIVTSPRDGSIVIRALVNNGEYPVNIDLTKECTRRADLARFVNRALKEGSGNLSERNLVELNKILRDAGYNTACLGCFVETRRYHIQAWADSFCEKYNNAVKKINKNAEHFGFVDMDMFSGKITNKEASEIENAVQRYNKNKEEKSKLKKKETKNDKAALTNEEKIIELVNSGTQFQKLLTPADLITTEGRTNLHRNFPEIESLVLGHYGSNTPKSVEAFTPYNNEYLEMAEMVGDKTLNEYLTSIAGGRSQSFSDYIVTHVFDHMQRIADLAVRGLPSHQYTKQPWEALIFGKTKEKRNLSIMCNIDPNVKKSMAGLRADGSLFVGDKKTQLEEKAAGREDTFDQSFPYDDALKIQHMDGYSAHNGMIGVGYSWHHNNAMLKNPEIGYIIGYHSSGMNEDLKIASHIDIATDYTNVQNNYGIGHLTKVENTFEDIPSYASWPIGETKKGSITKEVSEVFDIKKSLKKKGGMQTLRDLLNYCGENNYTITKDSEATKKEHGVGSYPLYSKLKEFGGNYYTLAEDYVSWCLEKNWLPVFYEFANDDNYFNYLFDFTIYDHNEKIPYPKNTPNWVKRASDGMMYKPSMQESVVFEFPDNYMDLIKESFNEWNDYQKQQAPKEEETYKAIYERLQHYQLTKEEIKDDIDNLSIDELKQIAESDVLKVPVSTKGKTKEELKADILKALNKNVKTDKFDFAPKIQHSSRISDREYMKAVDSVDTETAQRMVDEYASEKGYTDKFYHGTSTTGFTVFNTKWDSRTPSIYFFTDSEETAKEYGGEKKETRFNKKIYNAINNYSDGFSNITTVIHEIDPNSKIYEKDGDIHYKFEYDGSKYDLTEYEIDDFIEKIGERTYVLFGKPGNQLVIDAKGRTSSDVPFDKDIGRIYKTTDSIATWAKDSGYDSVKFKNIIDNSKGNVETVYAYFNKESIKSANTIIYDESGNVIPLSERFNDKNDDIRYSTKIKEQEEQEELTKEKLPVKARLSVSKAQTKLMNQIKNVLSATRFEDPMYLRGITNDIVNEVLSTGDISSESVSNLFDQMVTKGRESASQITKEYQDARKTIKGMTLDIPVEIQKQITDFGKRWVWNNGRYINMAVADGSSDYATKQKVSIDKAYQSLREQYPTLFDDISAEADQLERIIEVSMKGKQKDDALTLPNDDISREYQYREFKDSVGEFKDAVLLAKRYAVDKTANKEVSTDDVVKAFYEVKGNKRAYEKAMGENLLTSKDKSILKMLLNGEMEVDEIDTIKGLNHKGIKDVYNAQKAYNDDVKTITKAKKQIKQGLMDEAEELLEGSEKWKDKKIGLLYDRETAIRNFQDVMPEDIAETMIGKYLRPISENEADSNRSKNFYRDRVRQLDISRKIAKGNTNSESYAVQFIGEAQDNKRRAEANGKQYGKTAEEWQKDIDDFWKANPNIDKTKINNAISEFSTIYKELREKANEVLIRNGYEPIAYREGYFPHFMTGESDSLLAKFKSAFGIGNDVTALPTEINGLTENFKPGHTWFGNMLSRMGFKTEVDAVQGFDNYLQSISDIIYHTDNIMRLRALASQIRYRSSDKAMKERINSIKANDELTWEQQQDEINRLFGDNPEYALSRFVVWLDEYTNQLANKKSKHDRKMEERFGREAYNLMKAFEGNVAGNMVALNVSSALTNVIPITQAFTTTEGKYLLKGMIQTLKGETQNDGLADRSNYITNRFGSESLIKSYEKNDANPKGLAKATQIYAATLDKIPNLMEIVDRFATESIVRGRYLQNIDNGMTEEQALMEADEYTAGLQADRSKGSMPTLFGEKNPISKTFTMFQLEVNNQFSWMFKDVPKELKDKALGAIALSLFKFLVGTYLFNDVYEYFIGRRPALDPLNMVNDIVGDATGYKMPNSIDLATGRKGFKTEKKDIYTTAENALTAAVEELPFVGGLLGGGRVPISSALPDVKTLAKTLLDEDTSKEKKKETVKKELAKPLLYSLVPGGGSQIKKTYEGIKATSEGGSYTIDKTGARRLQYPIFNDSTAETAGNYVRGALFGKSSFPTARDWVEAGFNTYGARQTAVYDDMVSSGMSGREAKDVVDNLYAIQKTETDSRESLQRDYIYKSDLSDSRKSTLYFDTLASEKEAEVLSTMAKEKEGAYYNALMDYKYADGSGNKAEAIAKSNLTDDGKESMYLSTVGSDDRVKTEKKIDEARLSGVSISNYLMGKKINEEVDGKTNKYEAVYNSKYTDKEKVGWLYSSGRTETSDYKIWTGSDSDFIKHKAYLDGLSGDGKQEKVIEYIKKQPERYWKELWEMAGYKDTTFDKNFTENSESNSGMGKFALEKPGANIVAKNGLTETGKFALKK